MKKEEGAYDTAYKIWDYLDGNPSAFTTQTGAARYDIAQMIIMGIHREREEIIELFLRGHLSPQFFVKKIRARNDLCRDCAGTNCATCRNLAIKAVLE